MKRHQVFDKTYFIITSDHGYHLGQFGMAVDKRLPYEADIRVPMIIKGPGVPANIAIESPVVSIDLAPTILDMAGISIPKQMDGVSLLPLLHPISIKVIFIFVFLLLFLFLFLSFILFTFSLHLHIFSLSIARLFYC